MSRRDAVGEMWRYITNVFLGDAHSAMAILATFMAGGHALLVGPIGSGKTTLARALAQAIGGTYKRVQVNNETLPSDIIGFTVYSRDGDSRVVKGPIFANVTLLDELNRAPPRTLSALLESMQERHVTIDGTPLPLPYPHMVVATMNRTEEELGFTSRLPIAVLDRFAAAIEVNHVPREYEEAVVRKADEIEDSLEKPQPLSLKPEEAGKLMEAARGVYVDDSVLNYIFDVVERVRGDRRVGVRLSTRAPISMYRLARSLAFLNGRGYVVPDDVKEAARLALPHRVVLREEYEEDVSPNQVVEDALNEVPAPTVAVREQ
ncbi:ATPase [Thermocladium modestius]|uniref:ATPase n=1 Tax=Thermocladium modestius TaxID=62609 RepID=A0A830GTC6_9CREN|nr:MoxR family ATPase [Thermocladium modestius]GGP18972.1 ATPase [Thermocladium modestius]